MINKSILLSKEPHSNKIFNILFIIILLTSILLSYTYKTYDSYSIVGLKECDDSCYITISLSYSEIKNINTSSIIEYKNKKYKINNITYSEPYLNNGIAYQDVSIYSNLNPEESIINMNILSNKQRIIIKIKNLIFREE